MASSTTTKLAVIAILVVAGAYVAPKALDMAGTFLGDLAGANDAVVVDAAKMPFIARNTKLAWESSRPAVLTMNRKKFAENRGKACPKTFERKYGGQCDEYPMASTDEGGEGARTEEVPARENQCQGGSYVRQSRPTGNAFLCSSATRG